MTTLTLPEAFARVRGYLDEQQNVQAIGLCEHVLEQHPTNLEALRLLGEAHLAQRQYERAASAFDQVVRADPESIPARVGLGIAHERQGMLDAAVNEFEQALEVRPDMPELRAQLLRLYTELYGSEGATLRLSRIGLARLYAKGNMLPQAVQEFRNYVSEHPQRFDAWLGLLEALWRDRQFDQAVETARRILEQRPEVLKANLILGHILMSRGDERGQNYWLVAQRADPFYETAHQLFDPLPTGVPAIDTTVRAWDEEAAMARLTAAVSEPVLDDWFPLAEEEEWSFDSLEQWSAPADDDDAAFTGDGIRRNSTTGSDLSLLSSLLTDDEIAADDEEPLPEFSPTAAEPALGQTGKLSLPAEQDAWPDDDSGLISDEEQRAILLQLEALWQQNPAAADNDAPPTAGAADDVPDGGDAGDAGAAPDDSALNDIEHLWARGFDSAREVERLASDLRAALDDESGLTLHQPPADDTGDGADTSPEHSHTPLEPYQFEYVHTEHLPPLVSPTAVLLPPLEYHDLPPLETAEVPPIAFPDEPAGPMAPAPDAPADDPPAAEIGYPETVDAADAAPEAAPDAPADDSPATEIGHPETPADAADASPAAAPDVPADDPPAAEAEHSGARSVVERVLDIAEELTEGGNTSTAARALDLVERGIDALQSQNAATLGNDSDDLPTVRLTPELIGAPDQLGPLPFDMDWTLSDLNEPSALESAELNDPLLAELLELAHQRGHLDLADIIAGVDRYRGDAARIDQLGWSLYSLGVEIRHGGEVVELSDEEQPVGAEPPAGAAEAPPAAAAQPAPAPQAVLQEQAAIQPEGPTTAAALEAAGREQPPTPTVSMVSTLNRGQSPATVVLQAGRSQFSDFIPSGDQALDRMLEQLMIEPENHALALAMARFCAQTGRRELMNLLYRRPLRSPEMLDQIGEELEDLVSFVDDPATMRNLHRLLGDVRTRQGRSIEAVAAYGMTFRQERPR